jgi:hypothetical protein
MSITKKEKTATHRCQFFIENGLELSDLTTVETRTLQVDETYSTGCRIVPIKKPRRVSIAAGLIGLQHE